MSKRRKFSSSKYRRIKRKVPKRLTIAVKKVIKNMSEVKYAFVGDTITTGNDGPYYLQGSLNPDIAVGAGKNQRIGSNIRYKRLTVRWVFSLSYIGDYTELNPVVGTYIRFLIVQSRGPDTSPTAPNFSKLDIFDAEDALSTVVGNNFRVIKDRLLPITAANRFVPSSSTSYLPAGSLTQTPPMYTGKISVPINNHVNFKNSLQLVPSNPKDRYYIFLFMDHPMFSFINLGLGYFARISFLDT